MLQEGMTTSEAMKEYIKYSRCAEYPDVELFQTEKETIEKEWPAYEEDMTMSRLPNFFWNCEESDGLEWTRQYNKRLQHSLSRLNHHIHPLVDGLCNLVLRKVNKCVRLSSPSTIKS